MSNTAIQTTNPLSTADIAAAEKRGMIKGQVFASRAIAKFFAEMVRETFGAEAIEKMLAENKKSHAEAESKGEMTGRWDEENERAELQERAAVFGAFLGRMVEGVALGAHIDAADRHEIKDRNGDTWVISKNV